MMRQYIRYIILGIVLLLAVFCLVMAIPDMKPRADRAFIRKGNQLYHEHQWTAAETMYRKAIAVDGDNAQAVYNLGCALMMQRKDSLAVQQFMKAGQMEKGTVRKAWSYHNSGVISENHRQYGQAIPFYEEALRNNPSDDQTRYNLALCQKLLKNPPKNKNQNQNKNQKNNNKNKQNKNKQDQNKNQNKNQNQNQNKNQQNPNQPRMSKQNAEQLLNAAVQQEQATKAKLQKNMVQPSRKQLEDNW